MRAVKMNKGFVFIAHYVEVWNWWLNFRIFSFLHRRPELHVWLLPFWPIALLASVWYLLGKKPFNVVDTYKVNKDGGLQELTGHTILIRTFAWHFAFANKFPQIRERILMAAVYAQNELKVDVIGLGALTKAEWLTAGGKWLSEQDGIRVPVVHGDTATAWFVAERVEEVYRRFGFTGPIAVIGPTSKIGRAVILHLVAKGYEFLCYTDSADRFAAIRREIPGHKQNQMRRATVLNELSQCGFWLIGKAKPSGSALCNAIPRGAVVINFSVPDPLTPRWLSRRPDIRHFDGGLTTLPLGCTLTFGMRLPVRTLPNGMTDGSIYACWTGTVLHAILGWQEHEVGEVKMDELGQVADEANKLGICLPVPTSHLRSLPGTQSKAQK
ncbi:MAG: hypothetical protein UX20_C0029G0004 [Candidatus Magasanikbacteria bacterium GW2011_GWC2_45_8]|uniref:Shikimate/quinate 5-dehydrogenase n=1 Tax=Candidatus Magasanikbacteria bacterium GW2011_GWC2_45_8 TaxID=1619050 RepID=A0A0G1MY77_9BACT|nr:MAG: hypothetical protein UX20_C0029G0004 [Candidatus Magasanikbacteria bacterium GW2011_GWC2_45_8]